MKDTDGAVIKVQQGASLFRAYISALSFVEATQGFQVGIHVTAGSGARSVNIRQCVVAHEINLEKRIGKTNRRWRGCAVL